MHTKPPICLLLAVWGEAYITQFFDRSLRTLLAEGNLPALAAAGECCFLFLTRASDVATFRAHPLFPLVERYCAVRFVFIDDITFPRNHSATLTLSFERGMRSLGAAMTETYFIYLMSDYLFAENALSALIAQIRQGIDAVTAGNFQVIEENVLDQITGWIEPDGIIRQPARALVGWSLKHLHPVTRANIVNTSPRHTVESNRLFWRVDADTLIGRFYLRHTLCLKPKTADYTIGASWDYSFLRAFCPDATVVHLTDSDAYFVVELQPLLHEAHHIRRGAPLAARMAAHYEKWTTAEQRANAHVTSVFHAQDISPALPPVVEESGRFVEAMAARMQAPLPITPHPYWQSCVIATAGDIAELPMPYPLQLNGLRDAFDGPVFNADLRACGVSIDQVNPFVRFKNRPLLRALYTLYRRILLTRPLRNQVHWFHPRYLDMRLVVQRKQRLAPTQSLLVILENRFHDLVKWMGFTGVTMRTWFIAFRPADALQAELAQCPLGWMTLYERNLPKIGDTLEKLAYTLPARSRLFIHIPHGECGMRWMTPRTLTDIATPLIDRPGLELVAVHPIGGLGRVLVDRVFYVHYKRLTTLRVLTPGFFLSLALSPLMVLVYATYHLLYALTPMHGRIGSAGLIELRTRGN